LDGVIQFVLQEPWQQQGKCITPSDVIHFLINAAAVAYFLILGYTKDIQMIGKENFIMQTTIVKWGNSQGIRLPKFLLDSVNLTDNDTVEVTATDDTIIIKKSESKRKRETIQEIFADYDGGFFQTEEIDWGKPQGNEIW